MIEDPTFSSYLRFLSYLHRPPRPRALTEGAFLVAEIAYPELDRARYERRLASFAAEVRAGLGLGESERLPNDAVARRETADRVLAAMRVVLAGHAGLRGNANDYYDPRNSLLTSVLDRRVGQPLTLSLIYLDVAQQIGAPLVGVAFPTHFLTKWPLPASEGDDLFVDAFDGGRQLDLADVLDLFGQFSSSESGREARETPPTRGIPFDPRWLWGADTRTILTRLLSNLKRAYLQRGETALALEVTDRLVLLHPERPEEMRDRGLLRLAMGEALLAAADIAAYAERLPNAPDVKRLQRRIGATADIRAKLN